MKVGLVGTGMLGTAVGLRLLQNNVTVIAQNRTQDNTCTLESSGAQIVSSPSQVADQTSLLITCIKDADAVRDVAFGDGGIVKSDNKNLIVCDMSTINPISSKEIAVEFSKVGITMLDTPVMGGPNAAIDGKLVMMASGDEDSFQECKKTLDIIASKVFYLGKNGTAHAVKLAMNLQIAMLALALSEGIVLSRGASIEPKTFLEILNATYFKTGMSENKAYTMVEGSFEPTFLLKNLKKDLHTINETAGSFGLELPMSTMAEKIYQNATEKGFGNLDYTGILAHIEESVKKTQS